MRSTLYWSDGLIFSNETPIGDFISSKMLTCEYKLNENRIQFEQLDLNNRRIAILDQDRKRLGMIYKSKWSKSAKIELIDNSEFELKSNGILSNTWKIKANDNDLIEYKKGLLSKGKISFVFPNETLILAGLYILND